MQHLGLFAALPSPFALPLLIGVTWLVGRPFTSAVRAALPASRAERALVDLVAGVLVVSWLGTVLAVLALFRWWWFAAVWGAAALAATRAASLRRPAARGAAPVGARPRAADVTEALACAALLGFAAWLACAPSETFFLQDDASVYTIGGIHLAESGWLFAAAPPPPGEHALVQRGLHLVDLLAQLTPHFGPFYSWLAGIDTLEIGFLPLAKVWPAWATWWLGPARAVWATPLLAWVAVAVLLAWWRRALGRVAGWLAVLALVVSFPQIWFARYPLSEVPAQALLASALWLGRWARALGDEGAGAAAREGAAPGTLAVASAAALAALTMLRLEGLALGALVGAVLTLGWWRERRRAPLVVAWWATFAPLAAVAALAVAIANRHYVFVQSVIAAPPSLGRGMMAAGLMGVAGAWWLAREVVRDRERIARGATAAARWLPLAGGVAWRAWPALATLDRVRHPYGWSQAAAIALYWLPSGLALSVAGLAALAWRDRRGAEPELVALSALAAALALFTVWKPLVSSAQPWAMRRMVPCVMPALALGLAAPAAVALELAARAARAGGAATRLRRAALVVTAALAVVGGAAQLGAIGRLGFVWLHRDWAGVFDQLAGTAALFPRDALVFVEAGPVGARLTPALRFVFGVDARPLPVDPRNHLTWVALDEVLDDAAERERPLFFAATGEGSRWATDRWSSRCFGPPSWWHRCFASSRARGPTRARSPSGGSGAMCIASCRPAPRRRRHESRSCRSRCRSAPEATHSWVRGGDPSSAATTRPWRAGPPATGGSRSPGRGAPRVAWRPSPSATCAWRSIGPAIAPRGTRPTYRSRWRGGSCSRARRRPAPRSTTCGCRCAVWSTTAMGDSRSRSRAACGAPRRRARARTAACSGSWCRGSRCCRWASAPRRPRCGETRPEGGRRVA
ncbi:MAG: hypothetical protein IPK07_07445 [Deltaproteobacteria bacterium]|nr:hypothetical protein [Deltaproteobacteria bacterium]